MAKRRFTLYLTAPFFAACLVAIYLIARLNYNLFHSLADGASIVVAACAFTIIWNSRRLVDNNYFLYTGISFLFFALLDLMHLLGNQNMGVFPGYGNLGPAFYIASRYVLAVSFLIAPLFINRRLNAILVFAAYSGVTALILLSILHWQIFPVCFVEGKGLTTFKIVSDYVICLIFAFGGGLLLLKRGSFDRRVMSTIIASIILFIATGLTFTLYTDPFGVTNMLGHLFQIASFYLVYLAFVETGVTKPQDILFRKLKQNEEDLTENVRRLDELNLDLKRENRERRRIERELRESRAKLETALASMMDSVLISDREGRFIDFNDAFVQFNRFGNRDECPRNFSGFPDIMEVSSPEGRLLSPDAWPVSRAIRGETATNAEYILHRKDTGATWIGSFSFGPVRDKDGTIEGAVLVSRDITDQKRAQEALCRAHEELELRVQERTEELRMAYERLKEETREREQAEEQLRQSQKLEALGALAGGIAHDFNNILAAIIGFTELAQDHKGEDGRKTYYMTKVLEAGMRGRDLVKQMLTFSRKTEKKTKPLLLSSIVEETVHLLRASMPTTISIKTSVKHESGFILGDPVQIQQVLMNLATNAGQAMEEKGGVLEIEVSDFDQDGSSGNGNGIEPGRYTRLTVRDTGTGIPREVKEKIFDPFFTTKAIGKGTGLGLSTVMGIVKQSGGHITVESKPGEGSLFSVYLPRMVEETPLQVPPDDDPALPAGTARILLVDDEEDLLETGKYVFTTLGYDVIVQASGEEALTRFAEDPDGFDLVVTDQTMPGMTGVELAKKIISLRPDIPIILCTGFSTAVDAESARASGIIAFAMKPFTRGEMAKVIRDVLAGYTPVHRDR